MNKLFKIHWLAALCGLTMLSLTACNDDDNPENKSPEVNPDINVNVETYAGGLLILFLVHHFHNFSSSLYFYVLTDNHART